MKDKIAKKEYRAHKKQEKLTYKQKLKENKKYIKNKTINKSFPKTSTLPDNIAIRSEAAWKIVAVEDKRYDLVKGSSIDINVGDFTIIFGESGSGKTSFLSLLSALERPSEGNVCIFGENTCTMNNDELTALREKYVGYIFQQYGLLRDITVLENILITCSDEDKKRIISKNHNYKKEYTALVKSKQQIVNSLSDNTFTHKKQEHYNLNQFEPMLWVYMTPYPIEADISHITLKDKFIRDLNKRYEDIARQLRETIFNGEYVYEIIKLLEIDSLMNEKITKLSGGQQQRISIARAIAKRPKLLFADEPTGAVDTATAKSIMKLFQTLNKEFGTTITMVSHNKTLTPIASRIVTIQSGHIISDVKNEDIKTVDQINFE